MAHRWRWRITSRTCGRAVLESGVDAVHQCGGGIQHRPVRCEQVTAELRELGRAKRHSSRWPTGSC
jgi:hypothetical protein